MCIRDRFRFSFDTSVWTDWAIFPAIFHQKSVPDGKHIIHIESKYSGGIQIVEDSIVFFIKFIGKPPVLSKNDTIKVIEGKSVIINASQLSVSDVDNTPAQIRFKLLRLPSSGTLRISDSLVDTSNRFSQQTINEGRLSYQHNGNNFENDSFELSASDGRDGTIDHIRIPVRVTLTNDTPYLVNLLELSLTKGGSKVIDSRVLSAKDEEDKSSALIYSITSLPKHGLVKKGNSPLDLYGTFTQEDIDSSRIFYTHDKTNTTEDSVVFSLHDAGNAFINGILLKTHIGTVDEPPIVTNQNVTVKEDSTISVSLIANDPESKEIVSWQITQNPKSGILTGAGGTRTYSLNANLNGNDTIKYAAFDGVNWSDTGKIVISIIPVNDAPVWKQSNVDITAKEGTTLSVNLLTLFDKDIENDSVRFVKQSGVGAIGTDGKTFTYAPNFQASQTTPYTAVISAIDNGTPAMSSNITLSIMVEDSICKLSVSVLSGQGAISVLPAQTIFDPNTEVKLTATPSTDYVFKCWAVTGTNLSDSSNPTVTITMNRDRSITAIFVKIVETVTLNIGESNVHGSIFLNGYFFLSTRTWPAKLLRLNANNLSDYKEITFPSGYNEADQLAYSSKTGKLYTTFASYDKTVISEIDPSTFTCINDKIVDTLHQTSGGFGQTLATDGDFLYTTSFISDSVFGQTLLLKYSLSTFSSTPVDTLLLDQSCRNGHAMSCANGVLYVTGVTSPAWIAKINTSDMSLLQKQDFQQGANSATDDFAITANHIFVGTETKYSEPYSGVICRVNQNDLSQIYPISTGVKGGETQGEGYCFAVTYDGTYIWAAFGSKPGTLTRIDPVSLQFKNYRLDYNTPNEIVSDGKRLLITYWEQNPGVVQSFDLKYLEGREIP
jgi:hypothetical protein